MSLTEFLLVVLYLTLGVGVPLVVIFLVAVKLLRSVLEGARGLGRGRLLRKAEKTLTGWDVDRAREALFDSNRSEPDRYSALRYLILLLPNDSLGALLESVFELDNRHLIVSALKTIGQREMRTARDKIVALLEHHPSLDVRIAAAEALGYIGGLTTIPLLTKFERSLPRLAITTVPRDAVRRIQARILNAPDEGALSVVADHQEKGALAISDGRGSLSPADGLGSSD